MRLNDKGEPVCKICGMSGDIKMHEIRDYRLKISGAYKFAECPVCDHGVLDPVPPPDVLKRLYEKYYPRNYMPASGKKKMFWLRYISNNMINSESPVYFVKETRGKLLDIGCGNGDALSVFHEKGFECYGIEIDSQAASFCNSRGLSVKQHDNLNHLDYPDDYFDVIIMAQVIEHIDNAEILLKEINRILRPDGKVYITTPNFSSYMRHVFKDFWVSGWFLPFHVHLYSERSLKKLVNRFGFTVSKLYSRSPAAWFNLCVKSFLSKDKDVSTEHKSIILDSLLLQVIITPFLKLLDALTQRGDCLFVVLRKEKYGY